MFGVGLSAIESNKNRPVNYTLGFGLLWKLIFKKLRFIYWLYHRNIWLVLSPVFSIFHFRPYKEDLLWYIYPGSTEWALTHHCKYTAFCVVSSHSNTFKITYILLKFTQQNLFSCVRLHSGLKTLQTSFNMLQNHFVFHKGNGKILLSTTVGFPHAFPSGVMKSFPDIGVFKRRKWHSSWVLCHEGSGYDLSKHQEDFLSLPPCLLGWANSWPVLSPPITWAAKPPPLKKEGSHTTCSWLLKQVF